MRAFVCLCDSACSASQPHPLPLPTNAPVSPQPGQLFKKLIDSIKDLVTEGNFDCNESGMSLQAMVRYPSSLRVWSDCAMMT